MRWWLRGGIVGIGIAIGIDGMAQVLRYPVGVGATPFALATDYRALGWNPAGLTHMPLHPDKGWVLGAMEGGVSIESSVFNRADLWDDLLNREGNEQAWSGLGSSAWLDRLSDQNLSVQGEVLVAGSSRKSANGKWGVAYAARQSFVSEARIGRSTLDILTAGNAAQVFDQVIFADGDTLPNQANWTTEELTQILGGIDVDGDALAGRVLGNTELGFSWQKSHEIGVSRRWGGAEGWQIHTGLGVKLLLGNGYFRLQQSDGGLDAFGAFSNGFSIPRLDSAALSPNLSGIRQWGPVGQGWGMDLGVVFVHPSGHWFSGSLTDIGWMEWRGERYRLDISLPALTGFSTPNAWMDWMTRAMDPATWFQVSDSEVRRIALPTTVHLGAGTRLGEAILIAGDLSLDNGKSLGTDGLRLGGTAVFQLTPWLRIDAGCRKLQGSSLRIPVGFTAALGRKHFEVGARAGDMQALWNPSQPEVALYLCVARWSF